MESADVTIEPPRKRRRRPALSCIECRRRKIKCDRLSPCGPCQQAGNSICTYSSMRRSAIENGSTRPPFHGFAARSNPTPTSSHGGIRDRYSELLLPTPESSPNYSTVIETPLSTERSPPSCYNRTSDPRETVDDLRRQVERLQQRLSEPNRDVLSNVGYESLPDTAAKSLRGTPSKNRLFGPSHWTSIFVHFEAIKNLIETHNFDDSSLFRRCPVGPEVFDLLQKCKTVSRWIKRQKPNQLVHVSDVKHTIPPRELVDRLVQSYLRNFESIYRVLHIPTFLRDYNRYWTSPETVCHVFLVKLYLIMALGVCFLPNIETDDQLRSQALQWIYAAQSWVSSPSEKTRLNLNGLQIGCLLLMARSVQSVSARTLWISAGALLRTAIFMGLHRDPKYFPRMSVWNAEMRRRLWSTILELAVGTAIDAGQKAQVSCGDFDTEPPSNIDDAEIDETTKIAPLSKPSTLMTQTSLSIFLRKTVCSRLEIVNLANDLLCEPSYDAVLRLHKDVIQTYQESARLMKIFRTSTHLYASPPTPFHGNVLECMHHRAIITLHRPFANKGRKDPRYLFSRNACVDSALKIVQFEPDEDYLRLTTFDGGTFREVVAHSALTLGLELIIQLEQEADSGSIGDLTFRPNTTRLLREPIIDLVRKTLVLFEKRIALGQLNVKGHCFGHMILAQIEAMETGQPLDRAIFSAAKRSLDFCYGLLKEQVARINGNGGASLNADEMPEAATRAISAGATDQAGVGGENAGVGSAGADFDLGSLGLDLLQDSGSLDMGMNYWFWSQWDENSWH